MSLYPVNSLGGGGQHLNDYLPRILTELQGHTISGPLAGAAANTPLAVTDGIDIQDTILKVLMNNAGVLSDITSTTSIVDLRAKGTLTIGAVAAGDAVAVNGRTYTFQNLTITPTSSLAPGVVAIGSTTSITAANLAAAIKSQDSTVTTSVTTNVVTVIAVVEGTAGNSFTLSVAASNSHVTASGSTLAGGSVTNAIVSTTNTTSNQVLLFWYKKSRVIGQP